MVRNLFMRADMNQSDILLEAGTNELEVVEFTVGVHSYAVNALKVKQFVIFDTNNINPIPDSHESIVGSVLLQGQAISVVDLKTFLKIDCDLSSDSNQDGAKSNQDLKEKYERKVVIFCEFNGKITGYLADEVHKIQRITWDDIRPLGADVMGSGEPKSTGVVVINDRQITMLDL